MSRSASRSSASTSARSISCRRSGSFDPMRVADRWKPLR